MSREDEEFAAALASTEIAEELPSGYQEAIVNSVRIVRTLRSIVELEIGVPVWVMKSFVPEQPGTGINHRNNGGMHGHN